MKVQATTATLALALGLLVGPAACKKTEDTVEPLANNPIDPASPAVVWPDEPFRTERPAPKTIKNVKIPEIEQFELDNGLQVYLVQQKTLPTIMMFLQWDLGEVNDPKGKTGVASVCGDLLDEATAKKDKAAFSAAQSDHAVSIWVGPGNDTTNLGIRALERELGPALELATEMMFEPGLREDDFERIIEHEKASIEQRKGSASSVAYRIYPSLVWGSKHQYGKIETQDSVDKIKLSDCKNWAKKLEPDGARMWVVGKITKDELKAELDEHFGSWKGKAPKPVKLAKPKPAEGTIFFVHVPNAAQSQILIGHPGPTRDAEDYEATEMMAMILGGSFSSRINMNLREDKGWAYGARGGFSYSRGGSYFGAGSSVRSDSTGPAVLEIANEIVRMRTTDPTPEELKRELEGALLGMPADFSTATRTLFAFFNLDYHGLPLDWHVGYQERLRRVDTAAVRAAAEAHLQDTGHVVLVVGDGKVVLESLEQIAKDEVFGKGGIQYLDTDGNPVSRPTFEEEDAGAGAGAGAEKPPG